MLYRDVITLCFEFHSKHINALCGQRVDLLNVTPSGTQCKQWVLKGAFYLLGIVQHLYDICINVFVFHMSDSSSAYMFAYFTYKFLS
jgi:hypothetical protein